MATLDVKNPPDDLYARLAARAEAHRRSTAQEVTEILVEVLERREPLSLLGLRGPGKETWAGVDAARHVGTERRSWG